MTGTVFYLKNEGKQQAQSGIDLQKSLVCSIGPPVKRFAFEA